MDPNELVCAAKSGNTEAFERLVDRYYGLAYIAAFQTVGDAGVAKDLTQDAFVTAWTKLASLKQAGAFPVWLRRITRNLGLTWIKNEQYRQRLFDHYRYTAASPPLHAGTPADALERDERKSAVMDALKSLSPKLRDAVVAYYIEEQSAARAAATLGITQNTLKKRLSRARAQLRDHFEAVLDRELAHELGNSHDPKRRGEKMRSALALGPAFPALSDRIGVEALPTDMVAVRAAAHVRRVPVLAALGAVSIALVAWLGFERFAENSTPNAVPAEQTAAYVEGVSASQRELNNPAIRGAAPLERVKHADARNAAATPDPQLPATTLTGTVRDDAGEVVAGATVRLMLTETWQSAAGLRESARSYEYQSQRFQPSRIFETTSDALGQYAFTLSPEVVPSGIDNYAGADLLAYTRDQLGVKIFMVLESGKPADMDLRLESAAMVDFKGKLLGPDKRPVTDAVVGILAKHGATSLLGMTDDNGVFELMADRPGYANLVAVSPAYGEALLQYVDIQSGGPYTVAWPEGATLTGRLTWPDGRPAANVEVLLAGRFRLEVPRQGTYLGVGYAASAFTDRDGRYTLAGVPSPLDVSVQLYESEATPISPIVNFGDLPVDMPFVWDYVIAAPIVVSGVAIGTVSEAPVPDILLSAAKDGEPVGGSTVAVDESGQFEMRLLAGAGRYTIYPHFNVPEDHISNAAFGQAFNFTAGEQRELDLRITDPVTVRLHVTDASGNGVKSNGVLGLVDYDETGDDYKTFSNTDGHFETDEDGFLEWTPVMPGQPFVIPVRAGDDYVEARTLPLAGAAGDTLDVRLVLYEKATLFGRALDIEGAPLANALLRFAVDLPDRSQELGNRRTDANGWFTLQDAAPATNYTLTVWSDPNHERIESSSIRIDALPGETVDVGEIILREMADAP